jgi:hypothetical protein
VLNSILEFQDYHRLRNRLFVGCLLSGGCIYGIKRLKWQNVVNELRGSAVAILLISVITTIQLFSVLTARSYKLTEDAWATELVADCELWDVVPPSQPVRTLILACPSVDAIRLWPLPMQQPGINMVVNQRSCSCFV